MARQRFEPRSTAWEIFVLTTLPRFLLNEISLQKYTEKKKKRPRYMNIFFSSYSKVCGEKWWQNFRFRKNISKSMHFNVFQKLYLRNVTKKIIFLMVLRILSYFLLHSIVQLAISAESRTRDPRKSTDYLLEG